MKDRKSTSGKLHTKIAQYRDYINHCKYSLLENINEQKYLTERLSYINTLTKRT